MVVMNELHYRGEGERLRETVATPPLEDLYQTVVASFPGGGWKIHLKCVCFCVYQSPEWVLVLAGTQWVTGKFMGLRLGRMVRKCISN